MACLGIYPCTGTMTDAAASTNFSCVTTGLRTGGGAYAYLAASGNVAANAQINFASSSIPTFDNGNNTGGFATNTAYISGYFVLNTSYTSGTVRIVEFGNYLGTQSSYLTCGGVYVDQATKKFGVFDKTRALVGSLGTTVLSFGAYYRISFSLNQSTGAYALYINGSLELSGTAATSFNNGNMSLALLGWTAAANTGGAQWMDFIVRDDALPADGLIVIAPATGNGHYTSSWSANGAATLWQCVSDLPNDGNTTYVSNGSTANAFVSFVSTPGTSGTINAVQATTVVRNDTSQSNYKMLVRSSGTDSISSGGPSAFGTYKVGALPLLNDPATSSAWTPSGANAAEVGIEAVTGSVGTNLRVTAAYNVIHYLPNTTPPTNPLINVILKGSPLAEIPGNPWSAQKQPYRPPLPNPPAVLPPHFIINHYRGALNSMPNLSDAELGLASDTLDWYFGLAGTNYPLTRATVTALGSLSGGGILRSGSSISLAVSQLCGATINVQVTRNSGTPNTKIDIGPGRRLSFWEAIVCDSSAPTHGYRIHSTSTITIDTSVVGANGIDAGSLGASTWYYVHLIWNSSGSTAAGLISTSSSAPALPGGYDFSALIGAARTDGSSHFTVFYQLDQRVWTPEQVALNNAAVGSIGVYQSLSIASYVPPIAQTVRGIAGSGAVGNATDLAIAGDSSGTGARYCYDNYSPVSAAGDSFLSTSPFDDVPLITAQTIYWTSFLNTTAKNRLTITGWTY